MLVEDGRRLLISNLDLRYVASNDGNLLVSRERTEATADKADNYSREALELFHLFPEARDRLKLATAVRLSASFPYLSPAAHLPTRPRRRVVDAGYYDNYGTNIAAAWVFSGMNEKWLRDNATGVLLVQVRDVPSEQDRRMGGTPPDRSTLLSRGLEQLTTPPEGLWHMRESSSSFRNDGQLEQLSQLFREKERGEALQRGAAWAEGPQTRRTFTVVNFELESGNEVALSWFLTGGERAAIDGEARSQGGRGAAAAAAVEELKRWWAEADRRAAP
jgi:hypothetical protein